MTSWSHGWHYTPALVCKVSPGGATPTAFQTTLQWGSEAAWLPGWVGYWAEVFRDPEQVGLWDNRN